MSSRRLQDQQMFAGWSPMSARQYYLQIKKGKTWPASYLGLPSKVKFYVASENGDERNNIKK